MVRLHSRLCDQHTADEWPSLGLGGLNPRDQRPVQVRTDDRSGRTRRQVMVMAMTERRLRPMIEKWERDGLITTESAARLLRPDSSGSGHPMSDPRRARMAAGLGYLGASVVLAGGILVALTPAAGSGTLLLIGVLAMAAMRGPRLPRTGGAHRAIGT